MRTKNVFPVPPVRRGFTLVELLMVIAILGVLVGLTVVGVNRARRSIMQRAIALEVAQLQQAVEAYKQKYGEYPPDGSNWNAFKSHFQAVFPNIHPDELSIFQTNLAMNGRYINSISPDGVMDPAEALVFCLGGFSNDPQFPFTGPGGPIARIAGGGFQYNLDRNAGFFEFPQDRLTLDTSSGFAQSYDEDPILGFGLRLGSMQNPVPLPRDPLPAYVPKGRKAPIVYFSASTYSFPRVNNPPYFNFYSGTNLSGAARPYKSDQINTSVQHDPNDVRKMDRYYRYVNDKSFQIVSGGLDDDYGGTTHFWDPDDTGSTPVFFQYPTGMPLNIQIPNPAQQLPGSNYRIPEGVNDPSAASNPTAQLDNVTNFSEGTLESSLP